MSTATVTSKGQVTIPVDVRRALDLRAGSRLSFVLNQHGGYEIYVQRGSVRDLQGIVRWTGKPVSLEDMDEAIAAGASETLE